VVSRASHMETHMAKFKETWVKFKFPACHLARNITLNRIGDISVFNFPYP
jgi:hypothetical protein